MLRKDDTGRRCDYFWKVKVLILCSHCVCLPTSYNLCFAIRRIQYFYNLFLTQRGKFRIIQNLNHHNVSYQYADVINNFFQSLRYFDGVTRMDQIQKMFFSIKKKMYIYMSRNVKLYKHFIRIKFIATFLKSLKAKQMLRTLLHWFFVDFKF